MSLLKFIVLISLATLMITLATMALGLTIPLWTLNGFMMAVLHPYIYEPAALAVTMAVAWKANSIFKHNEQIREAVVRPLWKLEECEMALSLN